MGRLQAVYINGASLHAARGTITGQTKQKSGCKKKYAWLSCANGSVKEQWFPTVVSKPDWAKACPQSASRVARARPHALIELRAVVVAVGGRAGE